MAPLYCSAQKLIPGVLLEQSVPTIALPDPSHTSVSMTLLSSPHYHQTKVGLTRLPCAPLSARVVLGKFQPDHSPLWFHPSTPPRPLLSYYTRHEIPPPSLPPSPAPPLSQQPTLLKDFTLASNSSYSSCHNLEFFLCSYFLSHPLRIEAS